jgi:hypothetical protein
LVDGLFDSLVVLDDRLFDLLNLLVDLLSLLIILTSPLLDHFLDGLEDAVLLSDDREAQVANMVLHAVDLTLPDLLVRGIFLFQEHNEGVIRLQFEQVLPVHEVAKLVILHDQLDFVLVHHLLLYGQ